MPGRPDFTTPQTGNEQTLTVSNRPEVPDLQKDIQPPIDGLVGVEFFPPEGSVYRLKNLKLRAQPVAGGTGKHRFVVVSSSGVRVLTGKADITSELKFNNGYGAEGNWQPPTATAQINSVASAIATENQSLFVSYTNDSDVTQDTLVAVAASVREDSY